MPEISYGSAVALSPRLRRITAPNGGKMTGPGTNSYIVGHEELALVDPGPAIDVHIDAIVKLFGDRLKWILVTHTHRDHSPAARAIADGKLVATLKDGTGKRVSGSKFIEVHLLTTIT